MRSTPHICSQDSEIMLRLKQIIKIAGQMARRGQKSEFQVSYKQDNSPVTSLDIEISEFIIAELASLTPEIPVISEESEEQIMLPADFWLVDPIDGTENYIKGHSAYAINIALMRDNMPYIGAIYRPSYGILYIAHVHSKKIDIEQDGKQIYPPASIARGGLVALTSKERANKQTLQFLSRYNFSKVQSVSSSIKLCMIAAGLADVHPKFGKTMEWDTAAGHALILASGGDIVDAQGGRLQYGKNGFVNRDFIAYGQRFVPFMEESYYKAS